MPERSDQDADERTTLLNSSLKARDDDTNELNERSLTESTPSSSPSNIQPIPWKQIRVILVLSAAQPFANELIFPFINQMILEVGVVDDPKQVGFYSGVIETIFSLMSFLFVMPCSFISDRYGRKPVVLVSIAVMSVSVMIFGFSQHYWLMIVMRSIGGISGTSASTMKVMLGELTDKSTQATVFAMSAVAYRVGQILGQPVGGVLSHPERHLPFFDIPLWRKYPYAFPCVFSAIIALVVVLIGCFTLTETRPKSLRKGKSRTSINSTFSADREEGTREQQPWFSILTPHVVSVLSSLVTMVITSVIFFAVYPLFAFTPVESGGLGLSEAAIGTHMAIRSFISLIFMLGYGPIQARTGTLRIYQWSTTLWPFSVVFFPCLSILAKSQASNLVIDAVVVVFFIVWGFACLGWPSSAVLINDAAPSAESLASVVGFAQMAIILSSGVAPALGTALFALSKSRNVLAGNLIWVLLFGIGTGTALLSWTIKEATHDWRKDIVEEASHTSD